MDNQTPRKVKLKLKQPTMICSGRDFKECTYRGRILEEDRHCYLIEFKYKNEMIKDYYWKENSISPSIGFEKEEIQDIKLVE